MSQIEISSPAEPSERRYEVRRRRVRRKRYHKQENEWTPGDPRSLHVAALAIFAALALVAMLSCAVGNTGIGTPTLSVSEGQSGVSVVNHSDSSIRLFAVSLHPLGIATAKPKPGRKAELEGLSGSRFAAVVGGSFNLWPLHFWMGSVGATQE